MPSNPHTPVSNQPQGETVGTDEQELSRPPSHGVGHETAQQTGGGREQVKGHSPPVPGSWSTKDWAAPSLQSPDIGEASFGPPPSPPETVHGPDNRTQITNTSEYPWRAYASLLITAADGSTWLGTAWFIGPHTLATAGHCVYITNSGVPGRDGWVRSIQVMPGRDGTSLPYGFVTAAIFHSVTGWTISADENYDYGAIVIPTDLGSTTGWLGIGTWPSADLLATTGNIAGYPADKTDGTMWFDSRQIGSVTPMKVYYDIDTAGGQSGTAVYRVVDGERYGFAIHAYGGVTVNSGTRINADVYDNLSAWTDARTTTRAAPVQVPRDSGTSYLITGAVRDRTGAPVPRARVYLVDGPMPYPDVAVSTGGDGRFALSVPAGGLYTAECRTRDEKQTRATTLVDGDRPAEVELRLV
ncbi:carboxypeptidase regulatory-like domain-containing protein [Embleya sp. NPDC059259]|uniref:carboxypeptidase regulatory-like domain-containing protein n=1 Tax=unclassified Embleya TaxID=2699296 RepID=UPI0036C7E466